jgi:hypothetical protein
VKSVDAGLVVINRLGRPRSGVIDRADAEGFLDELVIVYPADSSELRLKSGEWSRVPLVEVTARETRVKS